MPRVKKGSKEPKFEEALARLEAIVKELEGGDLPLEDSLRLFEEGVRLTRSCSSRLETAQRRVDLLSRSAGGDLKLESFADEDSEPVAGRGDGGEA